LKLVESRAEAGGVPVAAMPSAEETAPTQSLDETAPTHSLDETARGGLPVAASALEPISVTGMANLPESVPTPPVPSAPVETPAAETLAQARLTRRLLYTSARDNSESTAENGSEQGETETYTPNSIPLADTNIPSPTRNGFPVRSIFLASSARKYQSIRSMQPNLVDLAMRELPEDFVEQCQLDQLCSSIL
jgi:hypothetical protein